MKRVLVKSLYDAFEYVMEHFYPYGQEQYAIRNDTYSVISIQDSHTGGIGFQFTENYFCKGVLTLLIDDKSEEDRDDRCIVFDEDHAMKIFRFINAHTTDSDSLLVHCYGGQSRSVAVGAFAIKILGGDNHEAFVKRSPNMHIYNKMEAVWKDKHLSEVLDKIRKQEGGIKFDIKQRNQPDFETLLNYSRLFDSPDDIAAEEAEKNNE